MEYGLSLVAQDRDRWNEGGKLSRAPGLTLAAILYGIARKRSLLKGVHEEVEDALPPRLDLFPSGKREA